MNIAILLAAGQSRRFKQNKIFSLLNQKPLLDYSLSVFLQFSEIQQIIIVINSKDIERPFLKKLPNNVSIIPGGETRMLSAEIALEYANLNDDDIVFIHDAARPLITLGLLTQLSNAVHEVGAAVCGMPVKNTIIECIEHKPFLRTLAREKLIEIYSPFAAKWKLIKKARNRAKREGYLNYPGFEDTCLFITDDMEVKIICDGYHNIKITTPEDLVFVSQLLKNYES